MFEIVCLLFLLYLPIFFPVFNRPQKLTVFVNPFSGKKKAVKIYREKVLPLFELADVKVTLIGKYW